MTLKKAVLITLGLWAIGLLLLPLLGGDTISLSELFKEGTWSHRAVWELRFPRMVVVLLTGGMLAALGATYQTLFHNPLCEPYILGISTAVTLGAVVGEVFHLFPSHSVYAILLGSTSALILTGFLILMASRQGRESVERIVLFGVGANAVLSAVLFLILSYYSHQMGGGTLRWFFGQVPWVNGKEALVILGLGLFVFAVLLIFSRALDALSLGDSVARTLGISPSKVRTFLLVITSVAVAMTVVTMGTVGFVGLVVPHIVRMMCRPQTSATRLILVFGFGAVFLGVGDVVSRLILSPFEFPIGVMTTVIGGPFFLYLLGRRA